MLGEENSNIILLKLKDMGNIGSVVFIDIFNDIFDLCGYPFNEWMGGTLTWTHEGVKQVNVQLNASKRDILRGLYEYYRKEHRYHGQV